MIELENKTKGLFIDVNASWTLVGMVCGIRGRNDIIAMFIRWGWCLLGGNPNAADKNAYEAKVCLPNVKQTLQEQ